MVPPGPLEVPDSNDPLTPLHEIVKQATASSQKDNIFLNFIRFSTTELCCQARALTTANGGFNGNR